MRVHRFTLACLLAACSTVSAAEVTPLEPSVYWRMEFGTVRQAPVLGYGFALRQGRESRRVLPELLRLDVSPGRFTASLAGVPLGGRSYRLRQNDEELAEAGVTESRPWYARQWVWWTAGGIALTAALTESGANTNSQDGGRQADGCSGTSGNVGPMEIPCTTPSENTGCVNGICVFCENGDIMSSCGSGFMARRVVILGEPRWQDTQTGYMGDLIER